MTDKLILRMGLCVTTCVCLLSLILLGYPSYHLTNLCIAEPRVRPLLSFSKLLLSFRPLGVFCNLQERLLYTYECDKGRKNISGQSSCKDTRTGGEKDLERFSLIETGYRKSKHGENVFKHLSSLTEGSLQNSTVKSKSSRHLRKSLSFFMTKQGTKRKSKNLILSPPQLRKNRQVIFLSILCRIFFRFLLPNTGQIILVWDYFNTLQYAHLENRYSNYEILFFCRM